MARMSLDKLNELLARALIEHNGLVTPDATAFKPWLPESYWLREAVEQASHAQRVALGLIDIANQAKVRRQQEDERLANMSVDELLGDNIPKLWDGEPGSRWGKHSVRESSWNTRPRTPTALMAPEYPWECYQCGRPITNDRRDHGGSTVCDLLFVDPIDIETESYWTDHTPKPWHGEEEDDPEP